MSFTLQINQKMVIFILVKPAGSQKNGTKRNKRRLKKNTLQEILRKSRRKIDYKARK